MRVERLLQLQRQLLLAELAHQLGLVLDQDDLALVDDADAVGHLLGLLDVVGGQDDGDAAVAQRAHQLPHVRRSSTSTPAVGSSRNRICGSCDSALAIITRRFMPPDSVMILAVLLVPQRQILQHLLDDGPGLAGLPNRPRLKLTVAQTRLEGVGGQLLRHQADHASARRGSP